MSQRVTLRILVICCILAVVAVVLFPPPATACSSLCQVCWSLGCLACDVHSANDVWCLFCPIQEVPDERLNFLIPPMPTTTVELLTGNRAKISIFGYVTTEMRNQVTSCLVAFSPVDSVARVDTVNMVATDSGRSLSALRFAPNPEAGTSLASLAEDYDPTTANWLGFAATPRRDVPAGIRNHFEIVVELVEGTDPEKFLRDLEAASFGSGGYTLGEDKNHDFIRRLDQGGILMVVDDPDPLSPRSPIQP